MKSVKCSECGFVGWADAERCKKCGVVLMSRLAGVPDSTEAQAAYQTSYQGNSGELKKGLAVCALVLGILNVTPAGFLGIGTIVGIVLAVVALKRIKRILMFTAERNWQLRVSSRVLSPL